ncbi:MAG: Gfo/Idh/MocA family oxidoreductase [Candidatus Cloacimonetes bacterium]|nr:Gfo/Idh/MocA family oxidoreductase [Candidatus Cloacimonadota bacterium]
MIRVLIIGYGSIAERHRTCLIELFVDVEIDIVTKRTDVSFANSKVFSSLDDVTKIRDYDYYIIANETSKHFESFQRLNLILHEKIIFIEKPLFEKCYPVQKGSNSIFVGYHFRFSPLLQYLRLNLDLSKVIYVQAMVGQYLPTWRPQRDYRRSYSSSSQLGGGVLRDLSHELDYLSWLFGSFKEFKYISEKISDLDIDSDDLFLAIGKLGEKVTFNLSMDYISKVSMRKLIVHTNIETWEIDFIKSTIYKSSSGVKSFTIENNFMYKEMHKKILSKNVKDVCSMDDALKLTRLIDSTTKEIE